MKIGDSIQSSSLYLILCCVGLLVVIFQLLLHRE